MKADLERVDFGGHPRYTPSIGFGTFLQPGRTGSTKKSSLFDLNPHKSSLGLNLLDYTADKLCPRLSLADLHTDPTPAAAAQLAGRTDAAAAGDGSNVQPETAPAPVAASDADDAQQQQRQQHKQQQPGAEVEAAAAAGEGARPDKHCSQPAPKQPSAAAAAPAAGVRGKTHAPTLDTLDSISPVKPKTERRSSSPVGGNSNGGFLIFDDSGSDSDSDRGPDSDAEDAAAAARARGPGAAAAAAADDDDGPGFNLDDDFILIDTSDSEGPAAGRQQRSRPSKQRRQQQQQDEDEDGSIISISDSESYGDGDIHTATTLSGEEEEGDGNSEADDFIPLLDISQPTGTSTREQQQQQQQRKLGYQPPWLPRLPFFSSPMLRLHNEIVAFCQMLAPTAEEVASRAASLDSLREVVRSIWPAADVRVFGSYETGLYTPASDTDVVVMGSGNSNAQAGLKALAGALESRHLVRNMQQVLTARVPIIKFEMIDSGLAFDVCWEVPSGPEGAQVVKQLLRDWPALKPLALVLKVFLTQRELNEVYTGGVGSYTLIIMIVAFLQLHASRRASQQQQQGHKRRRGGGGSSRAQPLDGNLGLLLLDFMRLYGRVLHLNRVGISCTDDGSFFDRALREGFTHINKRRGGFIAPNQVSLSVEDPIDPNNDTAHGSYNIKVVRQVFDHAYQLLNIPCPSNMSLLGRIIHLAPVVSGRPVPPWCVEQAGGWGAGGGNAAGRERERGRDRRDSGSRRHHSSSSQQRHKQRRNSGSRGREREEEQEGRAEKRRRKESRGGSSRSRSRSREGSRGQGHERDRQQQQQQNGSSGKQGGRHQHKHSNSAERSGQRDGAGQQQDGRDRGRGQQQQAGRQQQQQQQRQQYESPGSNRGGGMRRGYGSRQSFGSSYSEKQYDHRDKRRRN